MSKLYKRIVLFFAIFLCSNIHGTEPVAIDTMAQIELSQEDVTKLNFDNTVLGWMIKESGKQIKDLTEPNSHYIKFFTITYETLPQIGAKTIVQKGFFRELDPRIRKYITQNNNLPIKQIPIIYNRADPIQIKFNIHGTAISAPTLITKLD